MQQTRRRILIPVVVVNRRYVHRVAGDEHQREQTGNLIKVNPAHQAKVVIESGPVQVTEKRLQRRIGMRARQVVLSDPIPDIWVDCQPAWQSFVDFTAFGGVASKNVARQPAVMPQERLID